MFKRDFGKDLGLFWSRFSVQSIYKNNTNNTEMPYKYTCGTEEQRKNSMERKEVLEVQRILL